MTNITSIYKLWTKSIWIITAENKGNMCKWWMVVCFTVKIGGCYCVNGIRLQKLIFLHLFSTWSAVIRSSSKTLWCWVHISNKPNWGKPRLLADHSIFIIIENRVRLECSPLTKNLKRLAQKTRLAPWTQLSSTIPVHPVPKNTKDLIRVTWALLSWLIL